MPSLRTLRNVVASASVALFSASFISQIYLYSYFARHGSDVADAGTGIVYRFNNKGHAVFISGEQANSYSLTWILCLVSLAIFIVVVPKTFPTRSMNEPAWVSYVGGIAQTDLAHPSRVLIAVFAFSFSLFLAVFVVAGPEIASALEQIGVILPFGR